MLTGLKGLAGKGWLERAGLKELAGKGWLERAGLKGLPFRERKTREVYPGQPVAWWGCHVLHVHRVLQEMTAVRLADMMRDNGLGEIQPRQALETSQELASPHGR